mgnify:FL=1
MKNDGGPAFPTDTEHQPQGHVMHLTGMSLRDYFAAAALVHPSVVDRVNPTHTMPAAVAAWAYEIADAMLAERDK